MGVRKPGFDQIVRREQAAGSRLPYARHLDDVTVETRDGLMMQVIRLCGLPFETADTDELNYRKAIRDTMLRGIASSRFALYPPHRPPRVEASVDGEFADDFSRALDAVWRARLGSSGSMSTSCS